MTTATDIQPCMLYAEVCGGHRLRDKLGVAETSHAIARCLNRMERAASGFGGNPGQGAAENALAARFGAAEAAHLSACEMRARVEDLPPVSGVKLAVRIGVAPLSETGEAADVAAELANLAQPGQILVAAAARDQLPAPLLQRTRAAHVDGAFEVMAQGPEAFAARTDARLNLRYAGVDLALGPDKPQAAVGRDPQNDIVIKDPRASRRHARIEQRNESFVLTDQSSNGTYVSIDGGAEIAVKREEFVLRGRGQISFGNMLGPETAEIVEFDCSTIDDV